jgi:hypothetical protein
VGSTFMVSSHQEWSDLVSQLLREFCENSSADILFTGWRINVYYAQIGQFIGRQIFQTCRVGFGATDEHWTGSRNLANSEDFMPMENRSRRQATGKEMRPGHEVKGKVGCTDDDYTLMMYCEQTTGALPHI